jgi:hypothetical protein
MPSIINATTSTGLVTTADNSGSLQLATNSGTTAVTIDTGQNVGIGTASPTTYGATTKLAVVSTGTASTWLVGGTSGGAYAYFSNNAQSSSANTMQIGQGWATGSDNIGFLNTNGANPLLFATNGAERMRLTSAGSLNIGATSGTGKLYVESDNNVIRFVATNSTAGTEVIVQNNLLTSNNATASDYFFIGAISGGSDRVYILGNGNLQNINGSYGTISDANLKENIIDATPKLDKVMQLKVRNFNFIDDELKQIGFVAQELETVFPGLIEESQNLDRDGKRTGTTRKAVKTTVLIPILVKAMQEQQAAIQELKAELDALKAEVAALKGAQ